MNDFTKEELLVLLHDIGIINNEAKFSYQHADCELVGNLRKKLQSMIDNYDSVTFAWEKLDEIKEKSGSGA